MWLPAIPLPMPVDDCVLLPVVVPAFDVVLPLLLIPEASPADRPVPVSPPLRDDGVVLLAPIVVFGLAPLALLPVVLPVLPPLCA
jgi:hypothetical protein